MLLCVVYVQYSLKVSLQLTVGSKKKKTDTKTGRCEVMPPLPFTQSTGKMKNKNFRIKFRVKCALVVVLNE